ncbi:MAG: hypothetical protein OEM97_06645 [Acidimicrobiia bacterium]|nr:hypothetical protein [Acidimicrobiia bacterium]
MRRITRAAAAAVLLLSLMPAAALADGSHHVEVKISKAPVASDGLTAGAHADFVLSFADLDPAVPGIGLKSGAVIRVQLDSAFVTTDASLNSSALLQGWPQSPQIPFPYTTEFDANTLTLTLTDDWAVGDFGPGVKQVHLLLLGIQNPAAG